MPLKMSPHRNHYTVGILGFRPLPRSRKPFGTIHTENANDIKRHYLKRNISLGVLGKLLPTEIILANPEREEVEHLYI